MAEKGMLIVDAEVVRKVEVNRGDMNRSDFINFLMDNCLKEDPEKQSYVTKEEFNYFQQGTRDLLRNFLDFFISYGLELGKQPQDETFKELSQKLQELSSSGHKSKSL